MHYKFFRNSKCEFFPCHKTSDKENFNCLMCYCPLYYIENCSGNYTVMKNGIKDCTDCLLPHYDYELVVAKITERNLKK